MRKIEHARTITYLASHIPLSLWERGVDEITVAQTRSGGPSSDDRTGRHAGQRPLAGGARALGVHYYSKHGTEWSCWAVWLRDDVAGALDAGPGQPVAPPADNAALAAVLAIYNLTAR